ncbi:acyltransferase family protein [Gordonia sp. NB41Y]|uniref:acyltransferase family protein n=1 Tax=Gordonia sp. NB41Y TaxID=875808 RepID=UPI0009E6AADA|nr:acyltransferase family protein [Gordonia sp. NB41Y]WLP90300.1 acyltransferase family protein [Gordonia sp. NB41Y]
MPRPTHAGATYLPALDGLRALAVCFVVLYHLHVPGFSSGLLGVGVFFTLSGFLITSLLLATRERTGGFALQRFWLARLRRLLPAVVLVLGTSLVAASVVAPDKVAKYSWQALSALFYVNNWYNIGSADSYFDRFGGPGPFDHLWSLSIEEQFYLLWPLLLAALLAVLKKRIWVTLAILALAIGSFLLLNGIAHPGFDNTRAYEGTDTRAGGLLLGAALAFWWPARARTVGHNARCTLDVLALGGLALIGYLIATTPDGDISLYRSGIVLLTLATMAVLMATVVPETLVATVLALPPLRWIGERSYGIYLWHMPVIAFLPAAFRSEKPVATASVVIITTLVLSAVSWRYVEDPIRRFGFRKAFTTPRDPEDTLMNHFLAWLIALTTRFTDRLTVLQERMDARRRADAESVASPAPEGTTDAPETTGPDTPPDAAAPDEAPHLEVPHLEATGSDDSTDGVSDTAPADGARTVPMQAVADTETSTEVTAAVDAEAASENASEAEVLPSDLLPADDDLPAEVEAALDARSPRTSPTSPAAPAGDESTGTDTDTSTEVFDDDTDTSRIPVAAGPHGPAHPPHSAHGPGQGARGQSTPSPTLRRRRRPQLLASIVLVAALAIGGLIALGSLDADTPGDLDTAALAEDLPPTSTTAPAGPTLPVTERRTDCSTVVHVGDSTSIGMNSADTLPDPIDRITGRYKAVGAKTVITDIAGARSSLETVNGEPNAVTSIEGQLARGVRGCWVMAMGINDTANVEVGGPGPVDMRIDRLLAPLKGQPVLWPTVITSPLNENPAYDNRAMQQFDKALLRACKRYPNLRLYDWAAEAQPGWFSDGIHYTPAGYTERAYRFSIALATVFPAEDAPPRGCLLRSSDVTAVPPSPTRPAPGPSTPAPVNAGQAAPAPDRPVSAQG